MLPSFTYGGTGPILAGMQAVIRPSHYKLMPPTFAGGSTGERMHTCTSTTTLAGTPGTTLRTSLPICAGVSSSVPDELLLAGLVCPDRAEVRLKSCCRGDRD